MQYFTTLLPLVLWYSIGNSPSLSLAFHNQDMHWGSPSNSGGQQHHNIGKWIKPDIRKRPNCPHMMLVDLYGQHSSGGPGDALVLICGECMACKSSCFCGDKACKAFAATRATDFVATAAAASVGVVARLQARPTLDHHACFVDLPQNASRWLTSKWTRRVLREFFPACFPSLSG